MGFLNGRKTSPMKRRSQSAAFAAQVPAIYSASAVDNVMSSCFFEDQETALSSIRNAYHDITCLCSCDAPAESVYPSNPFVLDP